VTTAVVVFTRDLRVHDHPALTAACRTADLVVPLFVLDEGILSRRFAAPNRVHHLVEALHDLRSGFEARGGTLIVRRGEVVGEVKAVCEEVRADALHLTADVSRYARRRQDRLERLAAALGVAIQTHPGVTVHPAGAIAPSGADHFRVFTPYWRRWVGATRRAPLPAPDRVVVPERLAPGRIPPWDELVDGEVAPGLPRGGETAARERLAAFLDEAIAGYEDGRDDLAAEDGTSRLSSHLHLGTVSPTELAARLDLRRRGHEAFLRQLCWRDFNHQLLAANPDLAETDLRPQGDRWRDEEDAIAAWREGRTGYPIVDAGMRQLAREGWMHNRARMLVASFLTKHLRVDWRVGAWHFMDLLVDGDLANNFAQWQWAAGTGTDTRPNRMFNPVTQGQRYDPDGTYVRRYVPELAHVDRQDVHSPWQAEGTLLGADGYPPPIVDHREARERFLRARRD
jgi:deoxyribodipyrimidine photo-lyase